MLLILLLCVNVSTCVIFHVNSMFSQVVLCISLASIYALFKCELLFRVLADSLDALELRRLQLQPTQPHKILGVMQYLYVVEVYFKYIKVARQESTQLPKPVGVFGSFFHTQRTTRAAELQTAAVTLLVCLSPWRVA